MLTRKQIERDLDQYSAFGERMPTDDPIVMKAILHESGETFSRTAVGRILDATGNLVDLASRPDVAATLLPNARIVTFAELPGSGLAGAVM